MIFYDYKQAYDYIIGKWYIMADANIDLTTFCFDYCRLEEENHVILLFDEK